MRLDKEKIEKLAKLPDDELWREVVAIARTYGIGLSEKTPPREEMEKMRATVMGGMKLSMSDAVRLINEYKKGNKR